MCPEHTISYHSVVNSLSLFVCSNDDQFGAIHTPNILEEWVLGRRSMTFVTYLLASVSWASLSDRCHFPAEYQINSSRYYFVFPLIIFPPVAWSVSGNISSTSCAVFIRSSIVTVGGGGTCMIDNCLTKQ